MSATDRPAVTPLRKISILLLEVALFVAAFMAISAYQARSLLATGQEPAPPLIATTLQGDAFDLADIKGKPVLIYFFAPWCPYCAASADNIVRLRRLRSEERLAILVVALDWQERSQILAYASKHELNMPVVMGNPGIAADWKVHGFPTYYVLDSEHRVVRRDFGYSTQLGLLWRSWLLE
jgi:thiol-disulfide isomerase/thioredoxin